MAVAVQGPAVVVIVVQVVLALRPLATVLELMVLVIHFAVLLAAQDALVAAEVVGALLARLSFMDASLRHLVIGVALQAALLLLPIGACLRSRIVRRIQVAWVAARAAAGVLVDLLVDDLLPLLRGPVVAALVLPIHILPRVNEVAAVVIWVTLAHVGATHRKVQIFLLRRLCVGVRALLVMHRCHSFCTDVNEIPLGQTFLQPLHRFLYRLLKPDKLFS